ncbi:cysteate racemase [Tepidimicrobium xylanilyticum]|uniref:aspartate/glutamate racemase family protein n=1 Tax=Tepidimicrobium xylanilyticum TaxID=1123352 RepID=UPI00264D8E3D|nr:amino acid racemase [Tepidimicrobium xylanilyticum]GMG95499.1 aspartate racemase [Tepidimicrobium xylanilyticum]
MILGILGGMGPMATCQFFKYIIELTKAEKDQEHLHIIIDNNTNIPDRTAYILGRGEDPRLEMIRSVVKLESMGVDYIAIPCNTAHFFYEDLIKYTKVQILNMIEETARHVVIDKEENGDCFLLSTEGTYESKIYQSTFKSFGLNIIEPSQEDKKVIMQWIYRIKSSDFDISLEEFETFVNRYIKDENTPIIAGCTELSLLVDRLKPKRKYYDPMVILAKRCVELKEQVK